MVEVDEKIQNFPLPRSCPMLPPDGYAELRTQPPQQVRFADGGLAWILTRYEDVRAASTDPALSADITKPGYPLRLPIPPLPRIQSFIRMDAPEHTRLRRMAMTELGPQAVKRYRPFIENLAEELLDGLARLPQPADLVMAFALPLPSLVIARILGVPNEDKGLFEKHTRALMTCGERPEAGQDALAGLNSYLDKLVRRKLANPGDDLTSRLAVGRVATGELDHDDLVAMVLLILIAGHETTANQLALSVLTLLEHPAEIAAMRDRPDRLPQLTDELLRYWSIPQDNQVRVAVRTTELAGVRVLPGEAVIFALPAANHDETVFACPEKFDPDRDAHNHLAFGHGAHFCPGAPLVKIEMEVALPALFRRFPDLRLAATVDDLNFRESTVVYGVDTLPITW